MPYDTRSLAGRVALVTGAGRRIGAAIARLLHAEGATVVVHFHRSARAAERLRRELEATRAGSATLARGDLLDTAALPALIEAALAAHGRLDALVNNASSFYPTPLGHATEAEWEDLVATNLKAPFFLAQAARPHLERAGGAIVNVADIYGLRPLARHPVYSVAKAGLVMLTESLARELAPKVRVNAVAPGAILWPEDGPAERARRAIIARTPLARRGTPEEVARAVLFLLRDATYTTGETLRVDGGRERLA